MKQPQVMVMACLAFPLATSWAFVIGKPGGRLGRSPSTWLWESTTESDRSGGKDEGFPDLSRHCFLKTGLWSTMALVLLPNPTAAVDMNDSYTAYTSKIERRNLGKTSTALDVLQELQRSNRIAPFAKGGTAVVTGGNAGIGAETVKILAQAGMTVVLCTRRIESGREVKNSISDASLRDRVILQNLDLADLASIQQASLELVKAAGKNHKRGIDLLVNNAGVSDRTERQETAQGLELQWGTNHLGHHMLTRLLLPHMNLGGRIVTVSSRAHLYAIPSTDWGSGKYPSAYAQSKLCNILFAEALQDRLIQEDREDIRSVSLHPGAIATNIWNNTPLYWRIGETFFLDKTIEQGTATTVYCSLVDQVAGGGYYSDCHLESPSQLGQDLDRTQRNNLWKFSESIIAANGYQLPSGLTKRSRAIAKSA